MRGTVPDHPRGCPGNGVGDWTHGISHPKSLLPTQRQPIPESPNSRPVSPPAEIPNPCPTPPPSEIPDNDPGSIRRACLPAPRPPCHTRTPAFPGRARARAGAVPDAGRCVERSRIILADVRETALGIGYTESAARSPRHFPNANQSPKPQPPARRQPLLKFRTPARCLHPPKSRTPARHHRPPNSRTPIRDPFAVHASLTHAPVP